MGVIILDMPVKHSQPDIPLSFLQNTTFVTPTYVKSGVRIVFFLQLYALLRRNQA